MRKIIIGSVLATFVVSPVISAPIPQQKPQVAICNGQVVGQDPDLNIVAGLVRECGNAANGT